MSGGSEEWMAPRREMFSDQEWGESAAFNLFVPMLRDGLIDRVVGMALFADSDLERNISNSTTTESDTRFSSKSKWNHILSHDISAEEREVMHSQ